MHYYIATIFAVSFLILKYLLCNSFTNFRTGKYNATLFNSWVLQAKAPALPESLKLYKKLLSLGIKVVFLTGRGGSQRNATVSNLKKEGFLTWEKLILRYANT